MAARGTSSREHDFIEVLQQQKDQWVPAFLARAAFGVNSVVAVSMSADAPGTVAILSSMEASAEVKKRNDNKGAARLSGTPPPGAVWGLGIGPDGHFVWPIAMGPLLGR